MSAGKQTLGEKMGDWFRHILSCCDRDEAEERPALQISGPTNFRREDISIAGLDPEQQRFIREKAITDASKMWSNLQPLRSSPSGHFASPNTQNQKDDRATLPSYEQFTTPRSAPPDPSNPTYPSGQRRTSVPQPSPLDRVRAHTRKISNSLTKPLGGYQAVGRGESGGGGGSPYEMRALMDPNSRTPVIGSEGKMSGESFSVAGSDSMEDRDSGKGGFAVRV